MQHLEEKERAFAPGPGRAWVVAAVVGLLWLAACAADWSLRFQRFRWQQRLIFRPATIQALAVGDERFVTNWMAESRGGDLTRLAGIPSFAGRFEQPRPGRFESLDAAGFRNVPAPPELAHPIVVAGDSFMASGYPMTNMFAVRLAGISGLPVYNRAMLGVGPFLSLVRFVDSERFVSRAPRILVWGFIERSVIRHAFSGMMYQLDIREKGIRPADHYERSATRTRLVWQELAPSQLKTALPDTSAMAHFARRAWNRLRYALLGMINPEVFVAAGKVAGRPMLMYRPAVEIMIGDPAERNLVEVAGAIRYAGDFMARRGIRLVVVLIPDKEQVYRELVPAHVRDGRELPPSCLGELEERVRAEGIPAVNLLPLFRAHAAEGELLYWPDDTHWNERGIALAAEETWKAVRPLLEAVAAAEQGAEE